MEINCKATSTTRTDMRGDNGLRPPKQRVEIKNAQSNTPPKIHNIHASIQTKDQTTHELLED
jgi:hypothetical protein